MFRNFSRATFGTRAAALLLCDLKKLMRVLAILPGTVALTASPASAQEKLLFAEKKPNVVMLMTDDTEQFRGLWWGAKLGHPTKPNLHDPSNPVPLMDIHKLVRIIGSGD
jgi:hypothetical protein